MIRLIVVLIMVACLQVSAQPRPTVCYGSGKNEFTTVGPPAEYLGYKALKASARTKSANIEVTYEGFTPEAQAAFQEAVDIWEAILETPVTIRIHARWTPLATGVLGSASPGQYVYNFDDAPMQDVWYPIALAEKIAGKELNDPSEYDIDAAFNSAQTSWHFGLIGSDPPSDKYDLVTIVLHEIGHGLGITHAYDMSGGTAFIPTFFGGKPVIYETYIRTQMGSGYVENFTPPSAALGTAITSTVLYYESNRVMSVNSGTKASLYAPGKYVSGSSIAHLDEGTYPAGNINSLMTPAVGTAERILDPGPIVRAILKDLGWQNTTIIHTPLKDTEDATGPYHAVAKIRSDIGYNQSTVQLWYVRESNDSWIFLDMTPTANPNEYEVDIPGGQQIYQYTIGVEDNDGYAFNNVIRKVKPGSLNIIEQLVFHAGPDMTPPIITHQKKDFIINTSDFTIEANVTDNIGVNNVKLQWQLNGTQQPDTMMTIVAGSTSTYETVITKNNFQIGDTIQYRIRAQDSSVAGNIAFNPSVVGFNAVIITGLSATQDSYKNNFNDVSSADFFGNGFSVRSGASFDGHIQSTSPYPEAGATLGHLDLIYNLKVPIRVAAQDATVRFDEIVLVEPGEEGSIWPNEDFYDYVVVEGSTDGLTWTAIADGYDCRYIADWLNVWNNTFNSQSSTGVGTPTLYRPHEFNLLNKFKAGDEVAIRFRLYSDPFSNGWGWAIDNLKIQIDENPPTIRHQHIDFVTDTAKYIVLNMKVNDDSGVKQIFVDYKLNGGSVATQEVIVNPTLDRYTSKIDLVSLGAKAGDMIQYKIRAIDSLGNIGSFPTDNFITTAKISLTSSVDQEYYTDLTGNFFVLNTIELGFESNHPYDPGMGIDGSSDFSLVTKKPIKVSATNPWIYYEEMALVEYSGSGVKDYVVVEGSKDGMNWKQLVAPYASNALADWKSIYDAGTAPTAQSKFPPRVFDITANGDFKTGDVILVRFRLHSDSVTTGKGWYVFHLNIQGAVTGLEPQIANEIVTAWPNPLAGDALYLKLALMEPSEVNVEILNMQGQLLSRDQFSAPTGDFQREYNVSDWSSGLYLVKVKSVFGTSVAKLIKLK